MKINDLVYGHEQAKKVLTVMVNRAKKRWYEKCVLGNDVYPERINCLLIGESSTGKTHLINSLQKLHGFPLLYIDATRLTPTGNREGINSQQLRSLIFSTARELLALPEYNSLEGVLSQMIVFVDEFDKLANAFDSTGDWNNQVQSNFLTTFDDKQELSNISWVFAGAFSKLYQTKRVTNGIGFFASSNEEKPNEITDRDVIRAGLIPEIVGRMSAIVQLDTFTTDDYKQILVNQLLPKYQGLEVDIDKLAKIAFDSGQGVRSLTRQLEMLKIDAEFNEGPTL